MKRAWRGANGLLWLLLAVITPRVTMAEPRTTAGMPAPADTKTKDQIEAQKHFQRAKDLYQAGSYREAIAELDAARKLDSKAKDLVFNLGIVHEKLGKYDEAIAYFRQYIEMDGITPAERSKAESILKRVEGAKREAPAEPKSPEAPMADAPAAPPQSPPALEEPQRGRIDILTVNAGAVAAIGLGVGTAFGILAITNQPSKDFVTGRDGTYDDLKSKTETARTQAVIADVGFGVGIVALAVTAYLYFGRTKEPSRHALAPSLAPISSGTSRLSGGTFVLGGSFE